MPVSERDDFNYIITDIFLPGGAPDPQLYTMTGCFSVIRKPLWRMVHGELLKSSAIGFLIV